MGIARSVTLKIIGGFPPLFPCRKRCSVDILPGLKAGDAYGAQGQHCLGRFLLPTPTGVRSTGYTREPGLGLAVVCRHMAAALARTARVLRGHRYQTVAPPGQLVCQLAAKLVPLLLQNRLVQTGFGSKIFPRLLSRTRRRLGPVPYLPILDTDNCGVLAEGGRDWMQAVAAGMNALAAGFRLLPIAAELHFAAHGLLQRMHRCLCQPPGIGTVAPLGE